MHKFYIIWLVFICCCLNSEAGNKITINNISFKNSVASPDPDPAPTAGFATLIVPIKRAGNLIIVEATVDSIEGNFVLDTGAPYLVLNKTYFRDSPKINDQDSEGINGGTDGSFTTVVHNFNILDLKFSKLTADVTDLSAIENGRNIKILGLLGTRLFSRFAITVDLFRSVMYIQNVDNNGNIPEDERVFHDRFMFSPIMYLKDVVYLKGTIGTKTLWFGFDTGAETNLLDYNQSKKFLDKMEMISRSTITGVGGSNFDVITAKFDGLIIGDRMFMKNRVLLTSLEKIGKAYDRQVDGILGYDFFVRGIFTINFVKKEFEMYIYTNQ